MLFYGGTFNDRKCHIDLIKSITGILRVLRGATTPCRCGHWNTVSILLPPGSCSIWNGAFTWRVQICHCETGIVKVVTSREQNKGLFGMLVDKRFILVTDREAKVMFSLVFVRRGRSVSQYALGQGGLWTGAGGDGHLRGRYASYWNAFLSCIIFLKLCPSFLHVNVRGQYFKFVSWTRSLIAK